jgi:hypothetical protein
MKPSSTEVHNKDMNKHEGSMVLEILMSFFN